MGKKVLKWLKELFKQVLEGQVKVLQSDAFENRIAEKIAKKIPDYPGFGDSEQKVLAKEIVDMVTDELAEALKMEKD
jgi:Uri superfamily endonuclease